MENLDSAYSSILEKNHIFNDDGPFHKPFHSHFANRFTPRRASNES